MRLSPQWFWLLLAIPVALGLTRLHLDTEMLDLLPKDDRVAQGLRLYQEHFANARELIIAVRAADAPAAERAAQVVGRALAEKKELVSDVVWRPPWLEHPEDMAELLAFLWFNQPPEIFGELTNRLRPDKLDGVLEETRERLTTSMSPSDIAKGAYDPYSLMELPESISSAAPSMGEGTELFGSKDGTYRLLFVESASSLTSYRECIRWMAAIRRVVQDAVGREPDLAKVILHYTGRPAFVAEAAAGMQNDVTISVFGTSAVIALLFWLAHRRLRPMLWLLVLLALILVSTFAVGGLIFGNINIVSMGFAAILLGLAVDYAVIHYQEALVHPLASISQIRWAIAPSIFWAATTTICAFLVLNLGGLPGLDQLGSLVGLGVALSALVMIFAFLPPLFPERRHPLTSGDPFRIDPAGVGPNQFAGKPRAVVFGATTLILGLCGAALSSGLPNLDSSPDALRPAHSSAYEALDEMQHMLGGQQEPLWLLISAESEESVHEVLKQCADLLARTQSSNLVSSFLLPAALWPSPEFQRQNRSTAASLARERPAFVQAAEQKGFTTNSLTMTQHLLDTWKQASLAAGVFWPTNRMSRWILGKLASHAPAGLYAMGLVYPNPAVSSVTVATTLQSLLPSANVWLSGWSLLGNSIWRRVSGRLWLLVSPMVLLVLLSLAFAFRRPREVVLSLSVLGLSALCVLALMRTMGWKWNLMNLMGVPLILGTGVDYSIFMQLALKRYQGNLDMAYRSVGRALLLCGGTAVAGFSSLLLSSNAGMASLGKICALGIGANMLISVFLLPIWWKSFQRPGP